MDMWTHLIVKLYVYCFSAILFKGQQILFVTFCIQWCLALIVFYNIAIWTEESVKHNSNIILKYTLGVATCFGLNEAIFRPSVN
jgi:hypothetical protein